MDKVEITKSQEILHKITKIIETECAQDASRLLEEGGGGKHEFLKTPLCQDRCHC